MPDDDTERTIMLRVRAMTGREPVGMLDLLHVLAHPDVIDLTRSYLESVPCPGRAQAATDKEARDV